jgi:hypothetical protein
VTDVQPAELAGATDRRVETDSDGGCEADLRTARSPLVSPAEPIMGLLRMTRDDVPATVARTP